MTTAVCCTLVFVLAALLIDSTAGHTHALLHGARQADVVARIQAHDAATTTPATATTDHVMSSKSHSHMHEHVQTQKRKRDDDANEREDAAATWDNGDGPSFYFQFGGSLSEDDERAAGGGVVSVWTPVAITQTNVRIALDAVRYRNNYEKYITTRLCLHRVNLIRSRVVDDSLASFLFSVDGCESSKIAVSGRCDIYYCKLATYELKVTQKTAKKDVYIVQSIFKALTQKTMSELMQPSNLDITDDDAGGGGDGTDDTDDGMKERAAAASRGSSSAAAGGHTAVAGARATDKPKTTRVLRLATPTSNRVLFEAKAFGQTYQLPSSPPLIIVGAALLGSAGAAVSVAMTRLRRRYALQRRRREQLRLCSTSQFVQSGSSES